MQSFSNGNSGPDFSGDHNQPPLEFTLKSWKIRRISEITTIFRSRKLLRKFKKRLDYSVKVVEVYENAVCEASLSKGESCMEFTLRIIFTEYIHRIFDLTARKKESSWRMLTQHWCINSITEKYHWKSTVLNSKRIVLICSSKMRWSGGPSTIERDIKQSFKEDRVCRH